jgi:RNA polymerase sigma-70 factor (ECF subfamily)
MSERSARTDSELLNAAGSDPGAFGELYDRYAQGIYRWARRAGLTEADALDLVSELYARAWVSRKRFRDPGDGSAAPWLFGIARNLAASHRRSGRIEAKARKRLRVPLIAEADASEEVAERVDAAASRAELERAFEALPETHRHAVRLRVIQGLGYPDIALKLSCTEATARKWVSLGLRYLRTRMEATT